jgi:fructose-bisphosphate aldolase, class I
MSKQTPRSSVVMNATNGNQPTVSGDDHMLFYSQRYENYMDLPHYTGNKFKDELMKNAKKLAKPGKGILASDESTGTIGNRFSQIDVENTHENRIAYRELLFGTPDLEKYISGAILYDETARDKGSNGNTLVSMLLDKGILAGIKVDTGMVVIDGTNDESATQGLDGLGKRTKEYYDMGIRFAKWRAVVKIGDGCPSDVSI